MEMQHSQAIKNHTKIFVYLKYFKYSNNGVEVCGLSVE